MRLLTIHNLAYLQRLMAELRDAIDEGRLPAAAAAVRAGAAPWELAAARALTTARPEGSRRLGQSPGRRDSPGERAARRHSRRSRPPAGARAPGRTAR